ncbi:MAG: preprotein translocase subunit SecY, partial [Candidatus Dormibacteraceae bacterium]
MNLLEAVLNAFRLPELRNKLLVTAGLLAGYRVLANVSIPGASQQALDTLFSGKQLLGLINLFSGGGLAQFSVVALGITPYITASIIMQLMTVVSERIKQLQKEGGEIGRRRITRWTRYLTTALAFSQSYAITVIFQRTDPAILPPQMSLFQRVTIMFTITCGTIVAMWLGELISEHGIGNGISLIIFAGILARGPQTVYGAIISNLKGGGLADYLPLVILAILAVVAVAFI